MVTGSASVLGGTSGTTSYAPSSSELVLYAFGRCGLRGPQIQAEHMRDARTAANLILTDWANDQPNLWTVALQTISCVSGQITYTLPVNTILVLDAYIEMSPGSAAPTDLYLYPLSRTEYSQLPNKVSPGRPSSYWFDRTLTPTVYMYQPPSSSTWTLNFYTVRQIQDMNFANAQQPELPYPFLTAFADALSAELAVIYAPERAQALMAAAGASYIRAHEMNSERTPLYVIPGMNSYYR